MLKTMIKARKAFALLTAACMLAAFSITSCSSSGGSDGGSDKEERGINNYRGTYTVDGVSYNSFQMSGTPSGGDTYFSGNGQIISGSYEAGGASVRSLVLNGTYKLNFPTKGGYILASFNGDNMSLSNGSLSASGSGYLPNEIKSYFYEAMSNSEKTSAKATVIKYSFLRDQVGTYSSLESMCKPNSSNAKDNYVNTKDSGTLTSNIRSSGEYTGDLYANTNAAFDGSDLQAGYEFFILEPDGTGKYFKSVSKNGGDLPYPNSVRANITYTKSGDSVTITVQGSTNSTLTGVIGSSGLVIGETTYQKL